METIIKDLPIPKEVIEIQEALPLPEVVEPNNNARDFGILVGVIVAAAICTKLYACTARKKK